MQAGLKHGAEVTLFGFEGAAKSARSEREGNVKVFFAYFLFQKKVCAPLAQLVEQLTLNQWVPGSSP